MEKQGVSDETVQSLMAAGGSVVDVSKRFIIVDKDGQRVIEPVVFALDDNGVASVDEKATQQIRLAAIAPTVLRGKNLMERVEDLAEFAKRFKTEGSVIFADKNYGFTAVADYSAGNDKAAWNRHRAAVKVGLSKEILKWCGSGKEGVSYKQVDFCDLLEESLGSLITIMTDDPQPSQLLIMARDLEISETSILKAKIDAKSGLIKASFDKEDRSHTTIYPTFAINCPVIEGREPRAFGIRLKLVRNGDAFLFHVKVPNLEKLIDDEFGMMSQELAAATGLPVWRGVAPAEMSVN